MTPETLGVVGLGALGGSLAWQASRAGVKRVIGYSRVPKDGVAAVRVGAVTEIANDLERVIAHSDLVVIDGPPLETIGILERLAQSLVDRPVYCTDLASVKSPIIKKSSALQLERNFAGSHPFVDLQSSGFQAARPDLFAHALVYVTPLPEGELAAAEIADFWSRIVGAQPVLLDADAHDSILAWTSHMPQIVASVLAAVLAKRGPKGVTYGSGTLRATHPALADVDVWTEVILENRGYILPALDSVLGEFERLVADVEAEDGKRIRNWIEAGRRWRERYDE